MKLLEPWLKTNGYCWRTLSHVISAYEESSLGEDDAIERPIWPVAHIVHSGPSRCDFELGKVVIEGTPARAGEKHIENWKVVEGAYFYFLLHKLFLWEKR